MSPVTANLTSDHCAHAIIAASRLLGIDPIKATLPRSRVGRPRLLAAHAIEAMLQPQASKSGATKALARIFQVSETRLAPSGLVQAGLTPEALLEVAEAVRVAGFTGRSIDAEPSLTLRYRACLDTMTVEAVPAPGVASSQADLEANSVWRKQQLDDLLAPVCEPEKQTPAPPPKPRSARAPMPAATRAPVQLRPQEAAPRRQRDVSVDANDKIRAMFAGDDELIRRANAQGGFPRAAVIEGRTVWLNGSGQGWSFQS